jgi:hypothetical protein
LVGLLRSGAGARRASAAKCDRTGILPAVATGAAFFMIVLDTSTVKMALAAYKAARGWSRTPLYSVI